MVHKLIVSKAELFHTEGMDTVNSLLLSPPSLFLSSPPWGAPVLAWSNHPQQERISLHIVDFTLAIAPLTAARQISETDN